MRSGKRIREEKLRRALDNWLSLVREVSDMTECELEELLRRERSRRSPREQFIVRIHQRLSKLRSQRERAQLLREIKR